MKPNYISVDKKDYIAVGDIHGNFTPLAGLMKRYDIKDSCIIVCGDCGLGGNTLQGTKDIISKLVTESKKRNNLVIMFRGNHDDPSFFDGKKINYNSLIAVPDYTVINNDTLLVGGAISIDRSKRIGDWYRLLSKKARYYEQENIHKTYDELASSVLKLYWEDEPPVYDDEALSDIKGNAFIRQVLTHSAPTFCEPLTKGSLVEYYMQNDKNLEKDIDNERIVMDKLHNRLVSDGHGLQNWIYGHYHHHWMGIIDGIKYTMLDCYNSYSGNMDWFEFKKETT